MTGCISYFQELEHKQAVLHSIKSYYPAHEVLKKLLANL